MYWTLMITHFLYGLRYAQVGEYSVLSVMWVAPALKAVAYGLEPAA